MKGLVTRLRRTTKHAQAARRDILSPQEQIRAGVACAQRAAQLDQQRACAKRKRDEERMGVPTHPVVVRESGEPVNMDLQTPPADADCGTPPGPPLDCASPTTPVAKRRPRRPAAARRGEFLPKPTVASTGLLQDTQADIPSLTCVSKLVAGKLENAVFCARSTDPTTLTWEQAGWEANNCPVGAEWLRPAKWHSMVAAWESGNANNMRVVSERGAFNSVTEPGTRTPVEAATCWPPQLAEAADGKYVVRMTRLDPFDGSDAKGASPVFRCLRRAEAVAEMAATLHAALAGIGPAVYAMLVWRWKHHDLSAHKVRYGVLAVLEKCACDMASHRNLLAARYPPESALQTSHPTLRCGVVRLLAATAWARLGARWHQLRHEVLQPVGKEGWEWHSTLRLRPVALRPSAGTRRRKKGLHAHQLVAHVHARARIRLACLCQLVFGHARTADHGASRRSGERCRTLWTGKRLVAERAARTHVRRGRLRRGACAPARHAPVRPRNEADVSLRCARRSVWSASPTTVCACRPTYP